MKPEIKEKWLAALRSGDYWQTQEALKDCIGFCCLGVLCDIHKKETGTTQWLDGGHSDLYLGERTHLPSAVQEWAGLPDSGNKYSIGVGELASANDCGRDFEYIAQLIEKKY
jgi:hypothetical protein